MSQILSTTASAVTRLDWVEPEVQQLDVRETATNPGTGGDGQRRYPDCTRS
jgi:hypothetical protein